MGCWVELEFSLRVESVIPDLVQPWRGRAAESTCSGSRVKMQRLIFVSSGRGGQAAVCRVAKNMSLLLSVTYQLKSQFAPNAFIPPQTQIWRDS